MFITVTGKSYFLPHSGAVEEEVRNLLQSLHLPLDIFTFYANGKVLRSFQGLSSDICIRAHIPLVGGKGGYGAKLKTEGGKKVRPNDNMFSRDMSGQRVVYSTMERQYKEFIAKKTEEDQRVAKEREQFKVMENTLKEGQSFMKLDKAYKKEVQQAEKSLNDSIMIGKQKYLEKLKAQHNDKPKEEEEKEQQLVKSNPSEEEKKVQAEGQDESLKRNGANLQQQQVETNLTKKIKITTQISKAAEPQKPAFSSAQQRFKALFKK